MITTKELDKLVYEIAAAYTGSHHDYSRLASSVAISAYHKETKDSFSETMMELHETGVVNDKFIETINNYGPEKLMKLLTMRMIIISTILLGGHYKKCIC